MSTDYRAALAKTAGYLARLSEKLTMPDDLNEADQLEYDIRQFLAIAAELKDGTSTWRIERRAALTQSRPVAPTDAASRIAHYLEQRRLIRGLDPEVINALHAGTDEPRQAALTASDLEALARWATPANTTSEENTNSQPIT